MPPETAIPLVVTLKIDEPSQLFFDKQRTAHFPPYANYVPAHITLFHKLPTGNTAIENGPTVFANHRAFELHVTDIILQKKSVPTTSERFFTNQKFSILSKRIF